jgi:outer membrane receptor for ferric coprogen and ferric-rhodotorulic acid
MPQGTVPFADNSTIDSYEIIKGAAQVLYLNNGLNGTILEHTKQPLPYARDDIDATVNSFGSLRMVADFTGPIGTIDDVLVSYRVVATGDTGTSYFKNNNRPVFVFMPQLEFTFKKSTIRIYYDRQQITAPENANGLQTPSGGIYTGNGYKYADGLVSGGSNKFTNNIGYLSIFTSLSDGWQNELKGSFRNSNWYGTNVLPLSIDWDTKTIGLDARLIKINESDLTVMDDIQGHYKIGFTDNTDALGFIWDQTISPVQIIGPSTLPSTSPCYGGLVYESINQRADASLVAPDPSEFNQAGNPESEGKISTTLAYYAHSINIGQYLTLTGGVSYDVTDSLSIPNINTANVVPTSDLTSGQWLHRYGAILKPIKGLSVYVLDSTIFAQPNPYDYEANGSLLPNVIGTNKEAGVKADLWQNRINFDYAIFDMNTANLPRLVGFNSSSRGIWAPEGSTDSKGEDADVNFILLPGWQLHGSWFHTSNSLAYGFPMTTWSLFSSYQFPADSELKGVTIGGGFDYFEGLYDPLSGLWKGAETAFEQSTGYLKDKPGFPVKIFASYRYNKHWLFRISCDNLFDDHYAVDAPLPTVVDLSNPRMFAFEANYKF